MMYKTLTFTQCSITDVVELSIRFYHYAAKDIQIDKKNFSGRTGKWTAIAYKRSMALDLFRMNAEWFVIACDRFMNSRNANGHVYEIRESKLASLDFAKRFVKWAADRSRKADQVYNEFIKRDLETEFKNILPPEDHAGFKILNYYQQDFKPMAEAMLKELQMQPEQLITMINNSKAVVA